MASAATATAGASPPATPVLSSRRRNIAGVILAVSNFMVVLDLTVANVSVPHIAGNLGISPEQGAWIITGYAVAEAISVPLTGWLASRFGVVQTFLVGVVGFGIFSLLCGLSVSMSMIVLCRIGQGLCGGPIMPMSQTLLLRIFPPEKRGAAMGLWAMTTLLGPATGPILGGYISDSYSWHWIFLINIPIAAVCVVVGIAVLRGFETERQRQPIDVVGLLMLIFWIACLQIMLDTGREKDWFGDTGIVLLAIGAAVGFAAFVIWELTEEHPIVDLRIFRYSGFTFGVATLALGFSAYFASIVVIPQWLQIYMGYTAMQAGFTTAMTAVASITTTPLAAKLMMGREPRVMISAAIAWLGLMALVRTGWNDQADMWMLALPQLIQGFAMPFFIMPLTNMTVNAVKPEEVASAAGLQNFVRTMSLALATSFALTYWSGSQRVAGSEIVSRLQPDATQDILLGLGMNMDQTRAMIASLVDRQAVMVAVVDLFYVNAIVLFAGAILIWLAPRPKQGVTPPPGVH